MTDKQAANLRKIAEEINEAAAILPYGVSWAYNSEKYFLRKLRSVLSEIADAEGN